MHKVPQTILSRVQKFILRKITLDDLIGRLEEICRREGITAERAALEIVARRGEGSVRDSLSLLDQIIAFAGRNVTAEDVATILGLSDTNFFARVITLAGEGDHTGILEALQEASDSGRDFKMLYRDLLNFVRNLLLLAGGAGESMLAVAPEDLPTMRSVSEKFSYTELLRIANLLLRDDETVNRAEHQRLAVEIALLKAATFPRLKSVEQVLAGDTAPAPNVARTSARPKEKAPEGRAEARPASSTDLVERIRKAKPMVGSYLKDATVTRNGSRIVFELGDDFAVDAVTDARASIEQIASELYGERITIEAKLQDSGPAPAGRRAEDKPSPLRDDPVLSAFRKHLGGELVKESKR
jgi:DNA polymerase-3 subunit gamma/tau